MMIRYLALRERVAGISENSGADAERPGNRNNLATRKTEVTPVMFVVVVCLGQRILHTCLGETGTNNVGG